MEDLNPMTTKCIHKGVILRCYTYDTITRHKVDISGYISSWWWRR